MPIFNMNTKVSVSSGVISGGEIVINGTTEVTVTAGTGVLVDYYNDKLGNIPALAVTWPQIDNITITPLIPGTPGSTWLFVTSTGAVIQKPVFFQLQDYKENMMAGIVLYDENGIPTEVMGLRIEPGNAAAVLYDFIYFLRVENLVAGGDTLPVTGALSFYTSPAVFFNPGIGRAFNKGSSNILNITAAGSVTTPAVFDVILSDGTVYATNQTVLPKIYESSPGVVTALSGSKSVIHYVIKHGIGTKMFLSIGSKVYNTFAKAESKISIDDAQHQLPVSLARNYVSAQILLANGASDLDNPSTSLIHNLTNNRL